MRASPRWVWLGVLGVLPHLVCVQAEDLGTALEGLDAPEAFDRERSEVEVLKQGAGILPKVVASMEGGKSRLQRFRVERVFSALLDGLLSELESEYQALNVDQNELKTLERRKEAAGLLSEIRAKLEEWKKADPGVRDKVEALLELERLESREKRAAQGRAPPLGEEARREMERLRKVRQDWGALGLDLEAIRRPLLHLIEIEDASSGSGEPGELELLRMKELQERISERTPRVAALSASVEALGCPGLNAVVARQPNVRERVAVHHAQWLDRVLEKDLPGLFPEEGAWDALRYTRSLLWAWIVDRGHRMADNARQELERHLQQVLRDRKDPDPLVRERAADELYLLGDHGRRALEGVGAKGLDGASDDEGFLSWLLRWRIRPRVYARTGIDFRDYPGLSFRQRRLYAFEYARAAGEDAMPTLRAIVTDDELERSFLVKLAAAKALAGFRDLRGFNFLVTKHPDLTLKRPEVSRELLIVEAYEHIKDKEYQRAVEELLKYLEESPFDFRGNYQIAFAYLLLKNYPKAIHHFEICRRIDASDQLTLYNLACAYALTGKKSEALDALEAAVTSGFDDAQHMEKDTDLDSLREDPRYRKILESLRKG